MLTSKLVLRTLFPAPEQPAFIVEREDEVKPRRKESRRCDSDGNVANQRVAASRSNRLSG